MSLICHITTQEEWDRAKLAGQYEAPALKEEGFIHCSEQEQVEDIIQRYYKGVENVVVLQIDTEKLTSQLIFEWSPSVQNTFPHVYGPINLDAVIEAIPYH